MGWRVGQQWHCRKKGTARKKGYFNIASVLQQTWSYSSHSALINIQQPHVTAVCTLVRTSRTCR